jgi:SAM-dependent methyltransferase
MTFYPADLARIHDAGFGDFARAAVRELLPRLPGNGLVVELGCGSGIGAEMLTAAGYDVTGIDISEDMLAIARERAPGARFRQGSVWDSELPADCVGATAIGEVLNYAADDRAGADRLPELFERVLRALVPGGVFMFDFATPGRGTLRTGRPTVQEGDGWRIEVDTEEDPATQTLVRRMTIGSGGEKRIEEHTLRLYDRDTVEARLQSTGFRPEGLAAYDDFAFWPGYTAFAAYAPE